MQPVFIFPLLMSVLAMAISLLAATLAGVSAVPIIIAVDFIRLSLVHAIMAAEAGEKANATKAAAVSKVFMEKSPWAKRNRRGAGYRNYVCSTRYVSWRRKF